MIPARDGALLSSYLISSRKSVHLYQLALRVQHQFCISQDVFGVLVWGAPQFKESLRGKGEEREKPEVLSKEACFLVLSLLIMNYLKHTKKHAE